MMDKLTELHIGAFRGVRDLRLSDLGDINVIVGDNNTGKTSILESMLLWQNPKSIDTIVRNSRVRMPIIYSRDGWDLFDIFMHMFPFDDAEDKIISSEIATASGRQKLVISGILGKKMTKIPSYVTSSRTNEDSPLQEVSFLAGAISHSIDAAEWELTQTEFEVDVYSPRQMGRDKAENIITYLSPASHVSNRTSVRNRFGVSMKSEVVCLLQLFDPDITDHYLERSDSNMLPVEMINHRLMGAVPLYTFGDGLRKVCYLAAQVVASARGILLIDELETSIHVSVLPQIVQWLAKACQVHNVQIFASTHSGEAISALATAGVQSDTSVVCYRLEKDEGKTYARRYSEQRLNELVNGSGMDVR